MTVNLVERRLNKGLTIKAAAAEIGVNRMTLAALERGERVRPDNAKKVADFYGCKVMDLLALNEVDAA